MTRHDPAYPVGGKRPWDDVLAEVMADPDLSPERKQWLNAYAVYDELFWAYAEAKGRNRTLLADALWPVVESAWLNYRRAQYRLCVKEQDITLGQAAKLAIADLELAESRRARARDEEARFHAWMMQQQEEEG